MDMGNNIAEYLKEYHPTEAEAIKARDLCELFNFNDQKQLRNVISELRQDGEAICSSSNGYWYSKDPVDLRKTIHRMEGQVKNMNISIKGLKGILTGGEE